MSPSLFHGMLALTLAVPAPPPGIQEEEAVDPPDIADVPSLDLRAGGKEHMRYFLIGEPASRPLRLLLVLPGGDGSAGFNAFVRRIYKNALPDGYLVAQLVAPRWSEEQARTLVWPVEKNPWPGMEFATEEFLDAVLRDVEERHKIDPEYVFTLSWSSGGPAAYAYSVWKGSRVTGSFVAMSVFRPEHMEDLDAARGLGYYLYHSPEDFISLDMPETAKERLEKARAEVELVTYEGGHGWHGDLYGAIRSGIEWLERHHGKARKAVRRK